MNTSIDDESVQPSGEDYDRIILITAAWPVCNNPSAVDYIGQVYILFSKVAGRFDKKKAVAVIILPEMIF